MKPEGTITKLMLKDTRPKQFHSLQGYSIFLSLGGPHTMCQENRCVSCSQEDLVLMQPGHTLTLRGVNRKHPAHLIWIWLKPQELKALSDAQTDLLYSFCVVPFGCTCVHVDSRTAMLTKNLAQRLLIAKDQPEFGNSLLMSSLLSLLLVLILRACIATEFKTNQSKRSPFHLDQVFVYLRQHLAEDLSLQQLEQVFYISHEHMAREFKRQTGQTLHQYVLKLRLEKACRMLQSGSRSSEIWQSCGFHSYSYFLQAFKKQMGITPKAYVEAIDESRRQ